MKATRMVFSILSVGALVIAPARLDAEDPPRQVAVVEEFSEGSGGWLAGFSDYGLSESNLDRIAEVRETPPTVERDPNDLDPQRQAFYLQSRNPSSDVFLFLKKPLGRKDGVRPGQLYRADFLINLASNASADCLGTGTTPAAGYLKIGVSPMEPVSLLQSGFLRLNLDKGVASDDGHDAQTVSDISNGRPCDADPTYAAVQQYHAFPRYVQANKAGELWLYVGVDSAYPGLTGIYFDRIVVLLTRID